MKTNEERITALHSRAKRLSDERKLKTYGSLSVLLSAVLIAVMTRIEVSYQTAYGSSFAGTSMFGEDAGAYVLVAVISFTAAVCITVYCMRRKNRQG